MEPSGSAFGIGIDFLEGINYFFCRGKQIEKLLIIRKSEFNYGVWSSEVFCRSLSFSVMVLENS